MSVGWILLHRQICDNDYLWQDKPFSRGQAWIDLLMTAEIADRYSQKYGETIYRGQQIVTIRSLAKRWGWSVGKIFDYLNALQSATMVKIESNTKRTVITIANYDLYQDVKNTKRTRNEKKMNTNRTPTLLNKEVKEESGEPMLDDVLKKVKKKYGEYGWVLLSDDEHDRLVKQYGSQVVKYYITYIDESAQQTGNKNKWKDSNLTIRKAIRDGWGKPPESKENIIIEPIR